MQRRAVVLLSGGIDSTTTLAIANGQGFAVYALSFDYGQRHAVELECARAAAEHLGVREHRILRMDLSSLVHSALMDRSERIPKGGRRQAHREVPPTYVPARNTLFLAYALAWAETLDTGDIFIGANAVDYSGYPDCRPEYIAAFECMANLATKMTASGSRRVVIHTPLMGLSKGEIIRLGAAHGVDFSRTFSCYDPDARGRPCSGCDSCRIRLSGFNEANMHDPLEYAPAARRSLPTGAT